VTGDRDDASHRLLGEIERDFEALARLIERAIEHLTDDESVIERLRLAKEAAERGASLAKSRPPDDHV
jgi:hypothetical protein